MESVVRVLPRDNFTLELWFDTGDHRLFDMTPYLDKGVFTRLKNLAEFKRAYVGFDTVCWPDNLDLAPETLFDRSVPLGEELPL
ncbi:DUF2442 domain-containing protein [Acidithiobacillus sp. M4-SHS-6]|uniref:DUF2442 domain-containing protein n=1 Tax=Acidithiobacillus sp. M4-SHS-6 TaxID=3383024 RepID=UPI0039BE2FE8